MGPQYECREAGGFLNMERENIFGDVIILMLPLGKFSASMELIKKEDSILAVSSRIVLHFIPGLSFKSEEKGPIFLNLLN